MTLALQSESRYFFFLQQQNIIFFFQLNVVIDILVTYIKYFYVEICCSDYFQLLLVMNLCTADIIFSLSLAPFGFRRMNCVCVLYVR